MCESHAERLDFLLSSVSTVICSDHYTLDLSWLMHCDYWDDCGLVLFYFSLFIPISYSGCLLFCALISSVYLFPVSQRLQRLLIHSLNKSKCPLAKWSKFQATLERVQCTIWPAFSRQSTKVCFCRCFHTFLSLQIRLLTNCPATKCKFTLKQFAFTHRSPKQWHYFYPTQESITRLNNEITRLKPCQKHKSTVVQKKSEAQRERRSFSHTICLKYSESFSLNYFITLCQNASQAE